MPKSKYNEKGQASMLEAGAEDTSSGDRSWWDRKLEEEVGEYNLNWGEELGEMASDAWKGIKEGAEGAAEWWGSVDPEKREASVDWMKDVLTSEARQKSTIGDIQRKIQMGGFADTRDIVGDVPRSLTTLMREAESGKEATKRQKLYEKILANLAISKIPQDVIEEFDPVTKKKTKQYPAKDDVRGMLERELKEIGGPELYEKGQQVNPMQEWQNPNYGKKEITIPQRVETIDLGALGDIDIRSIKSRKKGKPVKESLGDIFADIAEVVTGARGESEETLDIEDAIKAYEKEKKEDRNVEMAKMYQAKLKDLRDRVMNIDFSLNRKDHRS